MQTMKLEAKERDVKAKESAEYKSKNIPAVMYGNDVESKPLWVNLAQFERVFAEAGTNVVVELELEEQKPVNVLIYDFQTDPLTDKFIHADFYVVNMKETVEAEIPLVFVGVAPAVKELGGTLVKNNDSLVVRALPADLPREITVDISKLATFDDSITVADLVDNDKIEVVLDDTAVIASVIAPRSEEEMAALDEDVDADVSKVEGALDKEETEEGEDAQGEATEKEATAEKTE